MEKQIVIARYNEDVSWVDYLNTKIPYVIYDKSDPPCVATAKRLPLPNHPTGLEADTYLYHIVQRYNELADHTIFLQGNPFDHCPAIIDELGVDYRGDFRILGNACLSANAKNRNHNMPYIYKEVIGQEMPRDIYFCMGAQFEVSREVIHLHPLEYYQKALEMVRRTDIQTDGKMANYFEFFWAYLFLKIDPALYIQFIKDLIMKETGHSI